MVRTRAAEGREEAEARRATELLAALVRRSGIAIREAERRMGWGQGTLNSILSGAVSLRFSHVAAVSEACGFPLGDFYMELAKGGEGGEPTQEGTEQPPKPSPELEQQVREIARKLYEEMDRAKQQKKPRKVEPK